MPYAPFERSEIGCGDQREIQVNIGKIVFQFTLSTILSRKKIDRQNLATAVISRSNNIVLTLGSLDYRTSLLVVLVSSPSRLLPLSPQVASLGDFLLAPAARIPQREGSFMGGQLMTLISNLDPVLGDPA